MENRLYNNKVLNTYTIFKDPNLGIAETISEEIKSITLTKFEKYEKIEIIENGLESIEQCFTIKTIEFSKELLDDGKIIPFHPQIANIYQYDISLLKDERIIKYTIYYKDKLIPLSQYFSLNKNSPAKIKNCFYKIACLFLELSEIIMLKLSLQNIYINEKEGKILLIFPPYSFFNYERKIEYEDPNFSLIIPPENPKEMTAEKYYSYLLGICMLKALDNKRFVKCYKLLSKNKNKNKNTNINNSLIIKEIFNSSNKKEIFIDHIKLIIGKCLTNDFNCRISISQALEDIAGTTGNIDQLRINKKISYSKYLINPMEYANYNFYFQQNYPIQDDLMKLVKPSLHGHNYLNLSNNLFKSQNLFKKNWRIQDINECDDFNFIISENKRHTFLKSLSLSISSIYNQITVSSMGMNELKEEKINNSSFASDNNSKLGGPNRDKLIANNESVSLNEEQISNLNKFIKETSNRIEPHEKIDNDSASQIIRDKLSANNKEISFFKTINFIKEMYQPKMDMIKTGIENLYKYQNEMTPKILEIFQKLRELFSLNLEGDVNFNQKSGINAFIQPSDLYKKILEKLSNLKATPILFKSLTNVFYIDVRELDLSDSNTDLKAFEEVIKMNSLFQNIIINQYDFTRLIYEGRTKTIKEEVQNEIFKKILLQEELLKFVFDHVPIEKKLIPSLSKSIKNKIKLEVFSVMKSNIDSDLMPTILESIKTCENLKILNISENLLKNNTLNILNQALKSLTFIEIIALNNCQIGCKNINNILFILKDKSFLRDLYLAGNDIGDDGIKYMKNHLISEFKDLRAISLANNNITTVGAEWLSHFLKNKYQLQYLRLGNNKIKAKGVYHIIASFTGKSCLNDFDLGNNEIGDEGSQHLEKYITKNQNLSYLNVMKNEISEERIISILNILKKQSTPCKINVFGNKAKDENIQKYFTSQISSTGKK